MERIHLSVVTADGSAIDKTVSYVNIPTASGSLGVLSGHASMLCAVSKGVVRYSFSDGRTERIRVGDGIANVNHNEVVILVSGAYAEDENNEG